MPTFDYQCPKCDFVKYDILVNNYSRKIECPKCDFVMKKLPTTSNFILKGSGFYKTDYKEKGKK